MVGRAHRKGRKEADNFLKQFVLGQMRAPDWPHYPMNDLRKMTLLRYQARWTSKLPGRDLKSKRLRHVISISCCVP
jgi:hypothetical protein